MLARILTSFLCLLAVAAQAQSVRLSEFMAENVQSVPDIVDFEDYPDWIELQNTTSSAVSLSGYFLSDDTSKPLKWQIPASASIPANGFLRIWADGHNATLGQTFPRGYWPWRDFTTEAHHTSFKLAPEGGAVVLTQATGVSTTTLIAQSSATWKYLADGSDQSTQWRVLNFDDSAWPSGAGPLGYGDSWITTTVPFGPDANNKHITSYFRKVFTVANPATVSSLTLRLLVDDGAVIYLNGFEVLRNNMPTGDITYLINAPNAISGADESDYTTYTLPTTNLVAGNNVIAVEVHQNGPQSSDLGFDLGLDATGVTAFNAVDSVNYTQQIADVSMGRDSSNPNLWVQLAVPTPGAANSTAIVNNVRDRAASVTISLNGGFYASTQNVTLNSPSGEIRYTLNGSTPSPTSSLYSAPIAISSTKVLRARVFEAGKPPGPIETRTYFIGETQGSVPFVSVVADPKTLFDDQTGIYYNQHEQASGGWGLHDEYKNKDAPGSIEYYAPGGALAFRVRGGIRMGGENNWFDHSQRAMNFVLNSAYGDDAIKYDLFPGTSAILHTGLTLREGGDAWSADMLRDAMWASVTRGQMTADSSDYRPSVVFINGAYWGIHDLRARWDDQWFFEHKRINTGDVDHLIYGHLTSGAITLGAQQGDTKDWLDLMTFMSTHDLSVPANWALVEARIDIDSYIDFVVAESYANNIAWPHNREFWRDRKAGGKWHWFLPDMDRTFQAGNVGSNILNQMLGSEDALVLLKTSPQFMNRLAQRFAAHIASTFKPTRIGSIIDTLAAEVNGELARHETRWSAVGGTTVAARNAAVQDVKDFMTQRDANVHAELQSELNLPAPVNLTLNFIPANGGHVVIAGVPVGAGTMKMFPNIAFDIKADPAPGYVFTGFTGVSGTSVTLTGASTITATFAPSSETMIGGTLSANTTLSNPSYSLSSDLIVPPNITLTINPGVTINLPAGRNIRVQGALHVNGTVAQPVQMLGRNGARWGGLSIESPTAPCTINHLTVRGASHGADLVHYPYAISAVNATITMDGLDVDDSENPVYTKGGSAIIRNSRLHLTITGDGININGGYAELRNNSILGNNASDSDGIDFNGGSNCIVSGNHIFHFLGFNSDAIDIGEAAQNILIEGNIIMENSDKAVSCGQGSTVTMRKNLIVNCGLGIGCKDEGSRVSADQNTFVHCAGGIEVYEKNFSGGGGSVHAENCIFSKCTINVKADALSVATVDYSLSDTTAMTGTGNLLTNPQFVDINVLNYQLQPTSPAIDAGNPDHAPDPDSTRADIGAMYVYSPSDYPFTLKQTVVIEEILANSGPSAGDWIELHNRTSAAIDISGWFISDDGKNLQKYRIPAGTVLAANGYVVFHEATNFGVLSTDPGRLVGFALSDIGETVYLSSAVNNVLTDYRTQESFGPSIEGETIGNIYKASSDTFNFAPLATPTPGAANGGARIGPIVITEIHYQPSATAPGDAEFIELMNVSGAPVTLYDATRGAPWRMTDGILFDFPSVTPLTMQPSQRIVLTRSLSQFTATYTVPNGTIVYQWTSGHLSNLGEQIQLSRPGAFDALNVQQFARVDSVNYSSLAPWPTAAAGYGPSLNKISVDNYGNEFTNWTTAALSPGDATSINASAPSITTSTLANGMTGAPYSQTLIETGGTSPFNWSISLGSTPPGLTLSSTGVLSGIPTSAGTFNFTVRLNDGVGLTDTHAFAVTIAASPISIASATLSSGVKAVPYSQTLITTGANAPSVWTLYSGTLPTGLSLSAVGTISGTPNITGTFNFAIKLTDHAGIIAVKNFAITIYATYHVPVVSALTLGTTTIGTSYNATVSAINNPKTFSITGLPVGLTANANTGVISGRPTAIGVFMVQVKASNPGGTSAVVSAKLVVKALPTNLVGSFTGIVERNAAANTGLGELLTLTTTSIGSYTVKITKGATTTSATGHLNPTAPHINVTIAGAVLSLTLDPVTNLVTGTHGIAAVSGWRSIWNALNPATNRIGYYSVGIDLKDNADLAQVGIPQGSGYASFFVAGAGTLTVTGKTADGQAISSAGFIGPNGEIAIYTSLYANLGSLLGTLVLTEDSSAAFLGNSVTGTLTWFKPTSLTRTYKTSFGPINLAAYGKYLSPTATARTILGLPDTGSASITFDNVGPAARNPSTNFTYNSANIVTVPVNPTKTTLKINKNTGIVSGAFTLVDTSPALTRNVAFQAIIVRPESGAVKAKGYFLLPQKPINGETNNTSPILSGSVKITQ
jgi:hypothetical protein